jgi:hypothetical protein
VPLSTAVDVDVFPSDLAAGGASGLEARSAKSGFSGLAGGLYSWYFTSRGLFFFGAAKASRLDSSNINRQKGKGKPREISPTGRATHLCVEKGRRNLKVGRQKKKKLVRS